MFKRYGVDNVAVTASTGIAGINIGGTTLHRFAGIGYDTEYEEMVGKAWGKKKIWRKTQCLIVDEISMISAKLFDNLEKIAREIRGNDEPFGGIHLILCGDFFQLPPVSKDKKSADGKFCFEGEVWKKCIKHSVLLTKVYRQTDKEFVEILNNIRMGKCTKEITEKLLQCKRPLSMDDNIEPTKLYSRNITVDTINTQRLKQLKGEDVIFEADDYLSSHGDKFEAEKLLKDCQANAKITLRVGAQVLLVRNLSDYLVNGSRGVVIRFEDTEKYLKRDSGTYFSKQHEEYIKKWYKHNPKLPVVRFTNGYVKTITVCNFHHHFDNLSSL